jgi:hypothetical protein
MTSERVRVVVEALMIEVQVEIADFVDSRNSDLMHLLSSLMTDSLVHYSLTHMMNCCCSNNVIFASMFDSMKSENNENLETTVLMRFERFERLRSEHFVKTERSEIEHLEMIQIVSASMQ